jgi:hypothetical protein
MNSEKILLISYHFPPGGGVHVHRAVSLAKYLPQNGFEVHVLTPRNPAVPHLDPSMLAEIPADCRIHHEWTLEPPFRLRKKLWARLTASGGAERGVEAKSPFGLVRSTAARGLMRLLSPDPQVLWRPFAFRGAARLIERENIGTVWVTAPPFSTFSVGNALKSRYPHVRLISDFRDEWLQYYVNQFSFKGNDYIKAQASEIERRTVELSDLVVTVTPATHEVMRSRYPDEPDSKFGMIPNGYDGSAFEFSRPSPHGTGKIVVSHVGTLYGTTSPQAYLDAMDRLPSEVQSRFETRFVGRVAEEFDSKMLENRKSSIKVTGFIPHDQALRQMAESDYLLLSCRDRLTVPGKLYEYLAAKKPIIGLVLPQSDACKILSKSGTAWIADQADVDGIAKILLDAADLGSGDPISAGLQPNHDFIRRFERSALAADYAELIRAPGVRSRTDAASRIQGLRQDCEESVTGI